MLRKCTKCSLEKDISQFSKNRYLKDGLRKWCKSCDYSYIKDYVNKNREKHNKSIVKYRTNKRNTVLSFYGGVCNCCGEARREFLCIDHVDGLNKKSLTDSGDKLVNRLVRENFPTGYAILCHNCNMSLGFYGYCPHNKGVGNE